MFASRITSTAALLAVAAITALGTGEASAASPSTQVHIATATRSANVFATGITRPPAFKPAPGRGRQRTLKHGLRRMATTPYYQFTQADCGGGITATFPNDVRSWYSSEYVYWHATVYRLTTAGW